MDSDAVEGLQSSWPDLLRISGQYTKSSLLRKRSGATPWLSGGSIEVESPLRSKLINQFEITSESEVANLITLNL